MGFGNTTVPSANDVAATLRGVTESAPALVIVWSAKEPHRAGEIAIFDGKGPWALGRGSLDSAVAEFQRQRPRASVMTGALGDDTVSRKQIVIDREGEGLALHNVGQARMRAAGRETNDAIVHDGDLVELRGRYLFVVRARPVTLGDAFEWPAFSFGEPDAFGIVGESPAAWKLRAELAFGARSDAHVLVHGASGTGKELCAAAIHGLSSRARKAFIARNAATFPPGLIDAELFGNVKNYPNAGMPEREGLVGAVDKGTLFLDEIGEIAPELQAHLLRLLDARGEYHRLGETHARRADVRLVCATNRPVSALKHDLVPRLKVRVALPPLEHRREDIPLIARHLLRASPMGAPFVDAISSALMETLVTGSYESNVRDLEHLLLRAMEFSRGTPPLRLPDKDGAVRVKPDERAEIVAALAAHSWNVSHAADTLGISRHALARLMKKHAIEVP
jgi:two-component system nitrogen regulation response regulator GlnG/two-component system response regulator HydG